MDNRPTIAYIEPIDFPNLLIAETDNVGLQNSAVVVWDMQNGIAKKAFNYDSLVQRIRFLLGAARQAGRPIIYSQHTGMPYKYRNKYQLYSSRRKGLTPKTSASMIEGSEEWKIIEELRPATEDLVLKKYVGSFFVGTPFEQILRNLGVDTLILAGTNTESGIEGTARHSAYLGFIPLIVEDGVGSSEKLLHDRSLEFMRRQFPVEKTDEIVQRLNGI